MYKEKYGYCEYIYLSIPWHTFNEQAKTPCALGTGMNCLQIFVIARLDRAIQRIELDSPVKPENDSIELNKCMNNVCIFRVKRETKVPLVQALCQKQSNSNVATVLATLQSPSFSSCCCTSFYPPRSAFPEPRRSFYTLNIRC